MEVSQMKRFLHKKLPAFLLALALMVSMIPMAGAEEDEPVVQEHSHTWSTDWTKDSTQHWHACDGCSEKKDAAGHEFETKSELPPTCYKEGKIVKRCSICGYEITETPAATGNHVFGEAWSANNTTHWHTCTTPGCTATSDSAAHQAAGQGAVTEPTCTADGFITYTCSICQKTYTQKTSDKLGHVDANLDGKCDRCSAVVHTHSYPTSWTTSSSQHWHQCSCGAKSSVGNHADSNKDGKCDTCGYTMTTTVTVTFRTLSGSTTQSVAVGGYPSRPSTPSTYTSGGTTYTFRGWTLDYTGSNSWYIYNRQSLVTPSSYRITNAVTFYAVYDTDTSAITYTVAPGEKTAFDADDFNDISQKAEDTSRDISWVEFSVSTTDYNNFSGDIYCGNTKLSRSEVNNSTFYYSSSRDGDYPLDDLYLVADKSADKDSLTLSFTAYRTSSSYVEGSVKLVVDGSGSSNTITYQVKPGGRVNFDEDDFNSLFRKEYSNYTLSYVIFDRPSSSAFADGTLYYDYGGGRDQITLTRSELNDYSFYYDTSSSSRYSLDELTFVADDDFKDDVTLSFRAYYSSSRYVDGTVKITTDSAKADITYEVSPGGRVNLDEDDFNSFFRDTYSGYTLQYVIFDRPSSSAFSDATLYYDYGGGKSQITLTRTSLEEYTFYYRNSDSKYYDLDELTFVADDDFKDDVTLSFRAYYSSSRYVDGTVKFTAGQTKAATTAGDIRYAATYGSKVQINAYDIARYFNKSYPGYTLQYVSLGGVPATGSLYYNYYGASKYGTSTSLRLTSSNYNSQVFYFSPANTSQFALTELTYVPSGYNYCAAIPFTAYGSNSRSVTGTILISVNPSTVPEVYGVTQRNTAVNFPASAISSAVSSATGVSLSGIQLLSLPTSSQGTLYVGTGSTRAATNVLYTYGSGSQQMSQLRFVPNSSYTGSVSIPYVAYNSSGSAIATGTFSLGVVKSARSFKDVSSSTWCYKYVVELSDANVIDGYADGSFKPDSTVTYGAALKLIMLAAGYPEQAPVNSNVFSGYLAKARSEGIITRSDVDLSKPITRLQVAQIAAGAMKLNTSNLTSVQPFTDTSDPAVRALNAAGIVEGYFNNGTSTYKPNNTLTRGQLSAIVWRMEQYSK